MAKSNTPKKLHLILQSKGGVGKSFFMWLRANIHQNKKESFFIDLDNSTQTSSRLVKVVGDERVTNFEILDEAKKIEREEFLNLLEKFSNASSKTIFVDFGAPESEEFLKFVTYELEAETLKMACDELNIDLTFEIIIAGNDTLGACLNYAQSLTQQVQACFPVKWFVNLGLSGGIDVRAETLSRVEELAKTTQAQVTTFGDLGFSQSAKDIVQMLASGKNVDSLSFASRLKFKQVMNDFAKLEDAYAE